MADADRPDPPLETAYPAFLAPHRHDCDCEPCVTLRDGLAAIDAAEREAWRTARDIVIR